MRCEETEVSRYRAGMSQIGDDISYSLNGRCPWLENDTHFALPSGRPKGSLGVHFNFDIFCICCRDLPLVDITPSNQNVQNSKKCHTAFGCLRFDCNNIRQIISRKIECILKVLVSRSGLSTFIEYRITFTTGDLAGW